MSPWLTERVMLKKTADLVRSEMLQLEEVGVG